jgi:hypothetical protein
MAKVIENVTNIKHIHLNGLQLKINCLGEWCNVATIDKTIKAEDLLGGKYFESETKIGNFVVSIININNIDKQCEFLLDKMPAKVFIEDDNWKKLFNDKEIELIKDQIIQTEFVLEKSPISKSVIHHFTKILIPRKRNRK